MSEQPPPYLPMPPSGASAPNFPSALSAQPSVYPGVPYQTFPPGYMTQPGYPGYNSGPQPTMYGDPPKHTVYLVDQNPNHVRDRAHGDNSFLSACTAALCCCCLWDMLTGHFF